MRAFQNIFRLSLATLLLSILLPSASVFAKAAGCYETNGSDYKTVACSNDIKNDAKTKCFVRSSSSTGFESIDCTELDSPPASASETSTGGGSSGKSIFGNVTSDGSQTERYLQDAIDLLTALAGLAIAGSVIFAGIKYSSSAGNPQAAADAKKRIRDAVFAAVALALFYTFLQWVVPGGAFN